MVSLMARQCKVAGARKTEELDAQRSAEAARGIIGLRAVVVDEDAIEAPVAEDRAAELAHLGG